MLKRCVQVALHNSPQVACASTYLVSNVFDKRPDLGKALIAGRSSEDDWRLLLKRDPSHASPGKLWELHSLRTHYHPSCRAWAEKLASSKTIQYGGDPLVDFGLMRFLDRFAYRNPKQRAKQHGHARTTAIDDRVPVKALTGKHLDSVAPEDRFFLRSFKAVASKKEDASSSDDDDGTESASADVPMFIGIAGVVVLAVGLGALYKARKTNAVVELKGTLCDIRDLQVHADFGVVSGLCDCCIAMPVHSRSHDSDCLCIRIRT